MATKHTYQPLTSRRDKEQLHESPRPAREVQDQPSPITSWDLVRHTEFPINSLDYNNWQFDFHVTEASLKSCSSSPWLNYSSAIDFDPQFLPTAEDGIVAQCNEIPSGIYKSLDSSHVESHDIFHEGEASPGLGLHWPLEARTMVWQDIVDEGLPPEGLSQSGVPAILYDSLKQAPSPPSWDFLFPETGTNHASVQPPTYAPHQTSYLCGHQAQNDPDLCEHVNSQLLPAADSDWPHGYIGGGLERNTRFPGLQPSKDSAYYRFPDLPSYGPQTTLYPGVTTIGPFVVHPDKGTSIAHRHNQIPNVHNLVNHDVSCHPHILGQQYITPDPGLNYKPGRSHLDSGPFKESEGPSRSHLDKKTLSARSLTARRRQGGSLSPRNRHEFQGKACWTCVLQRVRAWPRDYSCLYLHDGLGRVHWRSELRPVYSAAESS